MAFAASEFLPERAVASICDLRVKDPEYPLRVAGVRVRRPALTPDGRLNILAADHPARLVTKVGDDPLAMANRREYLARILRVVMSDSVDGVMATMDILEDLLTLDGLQREAGGAPLFDGKLLIASLNRGGLADACWELDDPLTGASPATCAAWRLDGAKVLLRVAVDDPASLKTILAGARAITESNALRLPLFLEPLPVRRSEKGFEVLKERGALAALVGVASALGDSSRCLWLKLPYCAGYETVVRATTLPVLLLGGESAGDAMPFLRSVEEALKAGPNVRGALVGRNVLYPGKEDPLVIAEAAGAIIHRGSTAEDALEQAGAQRGRHIERFSRWL
ncbi:MAG: deoxyribose-phosphate aldolase [Acidobacteria bacterium]|nr:deoxyribose-phosphate aldolase [Acidobacteriota bacterium]